MRHASIKAFVIAFGIVFTSALVPHNTLAAGNVLLPSGSGVSDTSTQPNLGIGAAPTSNASVSPVLPTQTPPTPPSASVPTTDVQVPVPAPQNSPAISLPSIAATQTTITMPTSAQTAGNIPFGAVPTHIIHVPDSSVAMAQMGKNLPYGLTFGFSSRSIFGANDVLAISQKLGLSLSQISSTCSLTVRGILHTDKSSYPIYGGNATQFQVRYDGTIQNLLLSAQALCAVDSNRLPPGSGYMTESGGRIDVPLQPISCAAPNRQVSTLVITYNGTPQSTCSFN